MSDTVLVFDSGVGALSLLPALRASLRGVRVLYASDNAAYPYGTRSADDVTRRVSAVLSRLLEDFSPELIVIGCNTASTVALPRLRSEFSIPVVGVVPAIKPAAASSRSSYIALLATPATVERPYTRQLINDFAGHCQVFSLGSSELADLAEQKLRGSPVAIERLRTLLAPLKAGPHSSQIDTIVLGCTHFPLLRDELAEAWGTPVSWIDSSEAIARRAVELLGERAGCSTSPATAGRDSPGVAIFTRSGADVEALTPALNRYGLGRTRIIAMSAPQSGIASTDS